MSVIKKIAVFRALQLGDLLCTVPSLRALRSAYPDASITLIGLPWAKDFVKRFSCYLDDFMDFPGYPPFPERSPDLDAFPHFIQQCRANRFDLLLQMHGDGTHANVLMSLLGAQRVAGFYKDEQTYVPDTNSFMRWPEDEHEIQIYLNLMRFLRVPLKGTHLEFPLSFQDAEDLSAAFVFEPLGLQPYVCIHPGARLLTRRWPAEKFARVADHLAEEGYQIVLTGTEGERTLTERVEERMCHRAVNLAGRTTLGALGILIKNARLLICNDTGVSHIASALKTPSVLVVTGSDPRRWAPLDASRHTPIFHPVSCRPCTYAECPFGMPCGEGVSVEKVLAFAEEKLQYPAINTAATV